VYTIKALPNQESYGTVSGAGDYQHGQTVTLIATPKDENNFTFINWAEDGHEVHDKPEFIFTITSSRVLIAHFQNVTGFPQQEETKWVKIYPVPAKSTLMVEAPIRIIEIRMIDLIGRHVYQVWVDDAAHQIDVTELDPGLYLLQVLTKQGISTHRVLITK